MLESSEDGGGVMSSGTLGKKKWEREERRMRKWAERKWRDSRTQRKAKGEIGSVRWIERGDCVLFRGHHSFTHGIRGRAGL